MTGNNNDSSSSSIHHATLDTIAQRRRFLIISLHLFPHCSELRRELYQCCMAPLEVENLCIRDNLWYHINNLKRYCSLSLLHVHSYDKQQQQQQQQDACRNAIVQALLFMEHLQMITSVEQRDTKTADTGTNMTSTPSEEQQQQQYDDNNMTYHHDFDVRGILIQMSSGMHDASSSMGGIFWLFLCSMSIIGDDNVDDGQLLLFFSRFMKYYDRELFMIQYKLRTSFISDMLYRACKEVVDIYYSKSKEVNRASSLSLGTVIPFEKTIDVESDSIHSQAIFTWRQKRNLRHHFLQLCIECLNFIRSSEFLDAQNMFSTEQMNHFNVKFVQVLMQMGTRESLLQASDILKQLMNMDDTFVSNKIHTKQQLAQYWYLMACVQHQLVQFNSCLTSFESAISTLKSAHETIDIHILYHFHHVLKLLESQKHALQLSGLYPAQLLAHSDADGYWKQICAKYEITTDEMDQLKRLQFTTVDQMNNNKNNQTLPSFLPA